MSKPCNKCKLVKPFTDFFKDKQTADGHYSICKTCKTQNTLDWRAANKETYNAGMRAYNKVHYRRLHLQRYKLSVELYDAMKAQQGGKCKVCQNKAKGKRPLAVDHCHTTGKVRGLLCYGCNRAMHYVDNAELLAKLLEYKKAS